MENIEREKKPIPSIKSTGSRSRSQKSKNNDQTERATNSAKQSSTKKSKKTKTEWITHYAYLNDKKREKLMELPDIPKKILAMYYFENLRLAEIAAVFGLTESRICQIHAQTILGLRAYLQRVRDR